MSSETKTYSLRTSLTIVVVLVGIIGAITYYVALSRKKPADAETEQRWASELERAFLAFDGVRSAKVAGSTNRIDYADEKSPAIQRETALKAARTATTLREQLKIDPQVTVLISVKGTPQYHLVYSEARGIVEEKNLAPERSDPAAAPPP